MSRFKALNKRAVSRGKFTMLSPALGAVTMSHVEVGNGRFSNATLSSDIEPCTATITVAAALDPAGSGSVLNIAGVELVEGIHWVVAVGDVNTTAGNLATSINNMSGFTASAVGPEISIEAGAGVNNFTFTQVANTSNLTFDPATGIMTNGSPSIDAPIIS